ncbi:MAG: hypothetical protein OEZ39_00760 [Gammaproteobacteria bacterium]|nr:hypothetical protein [Gammaproteobacteria bacterium]MDH5650380.1 hypothetical protein [Gammaproteobacteria bacterium]
MATDTSEHYILHIYIRDRQAAGANLVGMLEPISGQQWRFRTARELGGLLHVEGFDPPQTG